MAVMLTSSPRRTLRLSWPAPRYLALASPWPWRSIPLVNELGHLVEQLFPISSVIKESLGQMMSQIAQPVGRDRRLRPAAGRLRGARLPRLHPLRARAPAPDAVGHPALGPDVRVPPRAPEPVPATLQRDAAGDRAGPAGGPQPQHPAGHRLPLPEQRPGRHPGLVDRAGSSPPGSRLGSIAIRREGLYHGVWIAVERAGLGVLVPLPLEGGSAGSTADDPSAPTS